MQGYSYEVLYSDWLRNVAVLSVTDRFYLKRAIMPVADNYVRS